MVKLLPVPCRKNRIQLGNVDRRGFVREAVVLVLLMGGICELCLCDGLRKYDVHTRFHDDQLRHSSNIKVINNMRGCSVATTDGTYFSSMALRWAQVP
jgi:hypothetical protein